MIDRTIHDIEARIQKAPHLGTPQKKELLDLMKQLEQEVSLLSRTYGEEAQSIADFGNLTAGEGLKGRKDPRLFQIAADGFKASVERFELSHPVLVRTVNNICGYFSNLGI